MKYLNPFLIGIIAGIVLVLLAKAWQPSEPSVGQVAVERDERGKTVRLAEKMRIMQAGQPVGELDEGTRLWQTSESTPQQSLELLLTWNNDGSFETVFLDVADNETSAGRNARATLETRK